MPLLTPSVRNQQPPQIAAVDRRNPLARGLVSLLWCGHGKPFDLLNPSEVFTVTNAPLAASSDGVGRQVTTAGANGIYSARQGASNARVTALPLSMFLIGEIGTAAGSAPVAGYSSGTNGFLLHAAYGSRTRRAYCSGVNIESGTWSVGQGVFGLVADGTNLYGYDNGVQFGSVACASTPSYDSFSRYQMFGSSDTGSTTGTGLFQAVWNRALSPAEVKSLSANPWQIFEPVRRPIYAALAAGAGLSGNALAIASAAGNLAVSVPLAGASVAVATAAGQLSTAIPLSGAAAAVASAIGALSVGISLSGTALAQAIASGALSSAFPLQGGAVAQAAALGSLSIQFALNGAAIAQASATGNLNAGNSNALAGIAQAQAQAAGSLSIAIPLAGNAQVVATGSGNLGSGTQLAGAAVAVAAATGNLLVTVKLSGAALAQAIASGGMAIQIPLAGNAVANASSSGYLSGGNAFDALGKSPRIGGVLNVTHARRIGNSGNSGKRRIGGSFASGKRRIGA